MNCRPHPYQTKFTCFSRSSLVPYYSKVSQNYTKLIVLLSISNLRIPTCPAKSRRRSQAVLSGSNIEAPQSFVQLFALRWAIPACTSSGLSHIARFLALSRGFGHQLKSRLIIIQSLFCIIGKFHFYRRHNDPITDEHHPLIF